MFALSDWRPDQKQVFIIVEEGSFSEKIFLLISLQSDMFLSFFHFSNL